MTDTPEPGWRPDPDGGEFNRWFDGTHFTKRVQGEPPKASTRKGAAPEVAVDAPEPESIPYPKGSVKRRPPKQVVEAIEATETPEPESIPYPRGSVRRRPPKPVVEMVEPAEEPEPAKEPEPEGEDEETPDASAAADWPLPSTIAAVVSGVGIVGAFLLPLGRLPLVIAALGLVGSVIALALAVVADERRFVAVWGVGLGVIGVVVGVTIGMLG